MAGFLEQRRSGANWEDVRWTIIDETHLAETVAVVALGQASHAASLISSLEPVSPVFSTDELVAAAISSLEIQPGSEEQMKARRWHRDGLLFEVLSWIALVETHVGEHYLIRDPHLGSTTQGLDGLLLELDPALDDVVLAVILEDKCSENPRDTFRTKVLPAFREHHSNRRAPDLVANASSLLRQLMDGTRSVSRASAVLDINRRGYRASLAVESHYDKSRFRAGLFDGYGDLDGMSAQNREGGGFVVDSELREWFDRFAASVREALSRTTEGSDV